MKIKTIKVCTYAYKAARAFIKEQGATRLLGSGAYGKVYSASGMDRVFKIGEVEENAGYLAFVRQVIKDKTNNPLLPKIYSVKIFASDGCKYFVVEMERLSSMKKLQKNAAIAFRDMLNVYGESSPMFSDGHKALGIQVHIPESISNAMSLLRRAYSNANRNTCYDSVEWDLHFGNFMRRGNQLVITDPLA